MIKLLSRVVPETMRSVKSLVGRHAPEKLVYEARTRYNRLRVVDKNGLRYLVFDDPEHGGRHQRAELVYQSYMPLKSRPQNGPAYADYFQLSWIFNQGIGKVLMIGLGGGVVPRRFLEDYPEIVFTTVEIDPVVVEVAHRYFSLPRDERHRVITGDGRSYLSSCKDDFDLVLLDAFFANSVPRHLFTVEFFREVKEHLTGRGLLGINANGALSGPRSMPFRTIYATLNSVFDSVYLFTGFQNAPLRMQNLFLFALKERLELGPEEIAARAAALAGTKVSVSGYTGLSRRLWCKPVDLEGITPLSDRAGAAGGEFKL